MYKTMKHSIKKHKEYKKIEGKDAKLGQTPIYGLSLLIEIMRQSP